MKRINCFIEECRFNMSMKCRAPKVTAKLGGIRSAGRVFCEQFRPVP
ncbi:MAG: hypothetical protein MJA84_04450 [Firmicutes bacterium]|nr:hypothetical protein [Bacillota bacterium]